jgi:hypothetical protein
MILLLCVQVTHAWITSQDKKNISKSGEEVWFSLGGNTIDAERV